MEFLSASEVLGRIYGAVSVQTGHKKAPSNAKHEPLNRGKSPWKTTERMAACKKSHIKQTFHQSRWNKRYKERLSISVWNERKFSFVRDFGRRGNSEWFVAIKEMLARSVHKIRDAESMETSRASVLKLSFSPATTDAWTPFSPQQ